MLTNLVTVSTQVFILFLIIGIGYLMGKKGLISTASVKSLTNVSIYLAAPAVIIKSFIREFNADDALILLKSTAIALIIHLFSILLVHIVFRGEGDRTRISRFASIFSNAGFMGLPLQQAILGDKGVFCAASYIAVFNIVSWTYGVWCMGKQGSFSAKKLINPGVISVAISLVIFFFNIPIPTVATDVIGYFAALNTPVPMLIIGYQLSQCKLRQIVNDAKNYLVFGIRLLLVPFCAIIGMYLCGIKGTLLISIAISAAAPCATNTSIFANLFDRDEKLASGIVSFATLLSALTLPIVVSAAMALA